MCLAGELGMVVIVLVVCEILSVVYLQKMKKRDARCFQPMQFEMLQEFR